MLIFMVNLGPKIKISKGFTKEKVGLGCFGSDSVMEQRYAHCWIFNLLQYLISGFEQHLLKVSLCSVAAHSFSPVQSVRV